MKKFLSIVFCLIAVSGFSQDITGIWRGYFNQVEYMTTEDGNKVAVNSNRYKLEVQVDLKSNRFDGVTYSYLSTIFYGKATAAGTFNIKSKKVLMEELKLIEVRMSGVSDACIMTYFLQYSKSGDEEFLEGTYTSMNLRDSSNCGRGTVFLRRVITSDFYKEPFLVKREKEAENNKTKTITPDKVIAKTEKPVEPKKTTSIEKNIKKNTVIPPKKNIVSKTPPKKTDPKITPSKTKDIKVAVIDTLKKIDKKITPLVIPKVLATRENEVVRTITTNANEISINVYDNGTIDNDTVSVYLDKKLVISKQRLTTNAINVKFKLDDTNNYHELVMVAENLGEIPPNTSLMVVIAGTKQYEVRITSNEQKNAVVIFKYEKD